MKRIILGFGHKRQRGKDTACDYLVDRYGFVKDSFAFSLKEGIGIIVFGLSDFQLNDPKQKHIIDECWGLSPRDILQRAGTDAMRKIFGENIWVNTLVRRLKSGELKNKNICICDCRFENEITAIKNLGGIVVRIDRNFLFDPLVDNHPSEIDCDNYNNWDYIVDNNGDFNFLYSQIEEILTKEANKNDKM